MYFKQKKISIKKNNKWTMDVVYVKKLTNFIQVKVKNQFVLTIISNLKIPIKNIIGLNKWSAKPKILNITVNITCTWTWTRTL